MAEAINIAVGAGIIVINLIPFIVKKPKYLLLTAIVTVIMLFLLMMVK